jgi:hypothetical protein
VACEDIDLSQPDYAEREPEDDVLIALTAHVTAYARTDLPEVQATVPFAIEDVQAYVLQHLHGSYQH